MKELIGGMDEKSVSRPLKNIADKVYSDHRISEEEGLLLFNEGELGFLAALANFVREKKHGNNTYFNRNFHIEPTNICVFTCNFCSYSKTLKEKEAGWELSENQMLGIVKSYDQKPVTEVHIVGGVHPKMTLGFFCGLIEKIKSHRPELHIKAFTVVELEYMFRKAKVSVKEGLQMLKDSGLQSLPGGGAEIFHPEIRTKICEDKATGDQWLEIHETAHTLGIPSNATILYGHIENYFHRIDHMSQLRNLQDRTGGFNTFIPLKFRNKGNAMSDIPEVSIVEDLKNYAVSRIFLDNFEHIKAYWPMIGRNTAQLSLSFGVNDIDGTIDDSTRIYSMAGAEEQNPSMTTAEITELITSAGRKAVERDTLYKEFRDYSPSENGVSVS
jgi:aminodeoxyfutalosine synthase